MRKITQQAVAAFEAARPFKSGNTQVDVLPNVTILSLFGNEIAYQYNDPDRTLSITNCRYSTKTTKERLNGLNNVSIIQSNFVWYLNGKEWNGELVDIDSKGNWKYR